jgi:hypothetical protein
MKLGNGLSLFRVLLCATVASSNFGCGGGPSSLDTQKNSLPLTVSTSSLPNGTVNAPYSETLQASGGTPPITWSISANTSLPPGLSLSSSGTISGTPPTPGSSCFDSQATDSSVPPQLVNQGLCIGINQPDSSNDSLLKGNYAFLISWSGEGQGCRVVAGKCGALPSTQVATAGSFIADGAGNVTGVSDTNGAGVGVQPNQPFTGTYAIGADNRGTLSISTITAAVGTYAFSVGSISASGVATKGRMIQFAAGAVGSVGEFELQDPSAFSNSAVTGSYIFEWADWGGNGAAGVFTADGNGSITTGNVDQSVASPNQPLSGTYDIAAGSTNGRGTGTLTIAGTTFYDFAFYVVSASKMFLVSADSSDNPSTFVGHTLKQSGEPFGSSSIAGTSVFRIAGTAGPGVSCEVATAGLQTFDGTGTVTVLLDQNNCGQRGGVGLDGLGSWNYSVATNGRAAVVTSTLAGTLVYVVYFASPGTGFLWSSGLGVGGGSVGFLEQQSTGAFSQSSLDGAFFFGNPPTPSLQTISSGVATLKAGSISMTSDINENGTLTFDQSSQDTYAVAANGRVTTGSGNQVIYIISPTKFLIIDVNPADASPGITIAEQ